MSQTNNPGDNKPTEGIKSPVITPKEIVNFPKIVKKTVTIKPKLTTSILPESNTLVSSAEFYIQKIGGAFAGFGSNLPLGRKALTQEQEQAWFPSILGVSPNHPDWNKYINNYWNDLSVNVPIHGLELNCNISYKDNEDVGTPANVVHYILYKYCLIYGDIANSIQDANKSPKIRFYMWTKEEEFKTRQTKQQIIDSSFVARLQLKKDPLRAASVVILFGGKIPEDGNVDLILADLQKQQPAKFLKLAKDENLQDKAFIQRAINASLLRRPLNSEMIMHDDIVIGNNPGEAIAWLNKTENSLIKADLQNKLKIVR